ncbi:MAG: TRAP transporter large permease subunit [Gemmataceae bacterium]
MPAGPRCCWQERLDALKGVWATLVLFALVIGGMYGGLVTVTEAAALGAIGALAIGVARRRIGWREAFATSVGPASAR